MIARIAGICLLVQLTVGLGAHAQNVPTIYLVRHADKTCDEMDAPLNEQGHRRAECLANGRLHSAVRQVSFKI